MNWYAPRFSKNETEGEWPAHTGSDEALSIFAIVVNTVRDSIVHVQDILEIASCVPDICEGPSRAQRPGLVHAMSIEFA